MGHVANYAGGLIVHPPWSVGPAYNGGRPMGKGQLATYNTTEWGWEQPILLPSSSPGSASGLAKLLH